MVLTKKQEEARKLAVEWWNSNSKEPFVITGYAGTGKSTTVNTIIESIGLDPNNEVSFVTFTGKAASVLTKKGCFATTIHKLIYDPIIDEDTNDVTFILKDSLPKELKLIVIDEISMVSEDIYKDLCKFNIRIMALGDPMQLQPVSGKVCELVYKSNILLDEVMRQALDNPILYLATKARNKEFIRVGSYGENVKVINGDNIKLEYFSNADQIIAGKNNTVSKMNTFYRREILGIDTLLPQNNEKLICLRNNWQLEVAENGISQPLVNGLTGYCTNLHGNNSNLETFKLDFRPDYFNEKNFSNVIVDKLYFTDKIKDDNEIYGQYDKYKEILYHRKNFTDLTTTKINKFTYGYCITCHKMQGSEVNKLLFFNEFLSRDIYWNFLYTGITRAKEELILVL